MKRPRVEAQASHRLITRRAAILGGVQLAFVGALGARMQFLQVDQADQFRMLAEENRINIRIIPPARGEVFDRNGVALARNAPSYRIVIVREDAGDIEEVVQRLGRILPLDGEEVERAMAEMKRSAPFLPITIADEVTWEGLSRVSVNAPALPGVTPEVGLSRIYPLGSDYAHVLGYVGAVSEADLEELEDPDQLLRIPRFQIGKIGVEAKAENVLRGKAGAKRVEVNATGRVMRELDRSEGTAGSDLQLTVDSKLQSYVQARLTGESASTVVMDVTSGDLLAISSAPSFDPNLFVRGISSRDYAALTEDKYRPLASKAVQGTYPPASTFKMVVAMAALEQGLVDPEDTVFCPGYLEVAGRRFHCWKRSGHGRVDMQESIEQSCDVYFYTLALKVGIENISAMANRFGLGVRYDVPMSAVNQGTIPTKDWKLRTQGQDWVIGDTVNASIGQGYVLASPLQLAVMTARLASGKEVTPRLIKSIDGIEQASGGGVSLGMNESNLRRMRDAMFGVVNGRRGTAYGSRIIDDSMRMSGKTGTAQVRNISAAERASGVLSDADVPWEHRDHALFVNYAPYDNPKIAVSVVVEHGGGGSRTAAPIARDVTLQALYGGEPPLDAYPTKDRDRIREQQNVLRSIEPLADINGKDQA